ncbi:hypothetical protein HNQ80_001471 [Anaerosolibacter carboniphilus]|uniref:Uncharacterized protein n=1 Tax=Anaerosolibacter carboniphilus TaxID=1417629 RepID=A0A841KWS7_9FIRM|nr:hypothetical protein [Anaerosolibacter carboniphilus]MBB6215382.1 hypothetical protein [Anaerosolibacter carboniphilus]
MNENDARDQGYKLPRWVIAILIISLSLNVATYFRVDSLKQEIRNTQNDISTLSGSINGSVSSSMSQINEMLKKESSLITEFKYEFGEYKDKRIDLLLNVKPKVYTAGDKLYFSYKTDNERPALIEAQSLDNINFESKINVSILDNIDIDLIIDNGASRKTEKLESIYRPAEKFTARLSANPLGGSMTYNKEKSALMISYGFELFDAGTDMNEYILSDVKLSIVVNDKKIATEPIPNVGEHYYSIQLKDYRIPCKIGDQVDIYITARDNKGFDYSSLVESWKLEENGAIGQGDKMMEMGRVEIR